MLELMKISCSTILQPHKGRNLKIKSSVNNSSVGRIEEHRISFKYKAKDNKKNVREAGETVERLPASKLVSLLPNFPILLNR